MFHFTSNWSALEKPSKAANLWTPGVIFPSNQTQHCIVNYFKHPSFQTQALQMSGPQCCTQQSIGTIWFLHSGHAHDYPGIVKMENKYMQQANCTLFLCVHLFVFIKAVVLYNVYFKTYWWSDTIAFSQDSFANITSVSSIFKWCTVLLKEFMKKTHLF